MMDDPIDNLLDQAIAYAAKIRDDEPTDPSFHSFVYKFPNEQLTSYDQILDGEHGFIEMQENKSGQRGMYAKCDIDAGTWVAISQPIAAYWGVEDDDEEDDNGGDTKKGSSSPAVKSKSKQQQTTTDDANEDRDTKSKSKQQLTTTTDDANENRDTKTEGKLILRVLEKIKSCPSIWENTITKMFPRDMNTAKALPPWTCSDDTLDVETQMKGLTKLSLFPSETCEEIALRLPLIIRYNAFIIDTSSELFVYSNPHHGMTSLAGVGLYGPVLSYFNHSCKPNVSKISIGDVTILFANRDIKAGNELCHSYLSHEYLCESDETRNAILGNDFSLEETNHDGCDNNAYKKEEQPAKRMKGESTETSTDTICVPPFILSQWYDSETGVLNKPEGPGQSFRCIDMYLFPIWKARILESQGRSNKHKFDKKNGLEHALPQWQTAIEFAEATFPPLDVRKIALYVQAALCASVCSFGEWKRLAVRTKGWRVGNIQIAQQYANKALDMHNTIFGGGLKLFLKRYSNEFLKSDKFRKHMSEAHLLFSLEELWAFGDELWENLSASEERGKELIKHS